MNVSDIVKHLQIIAPPALAESWDNVGLLVGHIDNSVTRVVLCIDYTDAVAKETLQKNAQMVIAYHPPIFKPVHRVLSEGATRQIYDAIRNNISIYSPHTALDMVEGGTNDCLADIVNLVNRKPLRNSPTKVTHLKLITFIPNEYVDKVASKLYEAGAGWTGAYSNCSFRSIGTGTFFGQPGTNPNIGKPGKLETVTEIKLETILPIAKLDAVVTALRESHPYEEPAFDIFEQIPPPSNIGLGRIGDLPQDMDRALLIKKIKETIGISHVLVAGPGIGNARKVAVCAGACGDLLNEAINQNADVYITGEMRHHDALQAVNAGLTVICLLHSNSERLTLKHLAARLQSQLPQVDFWVSRQDQDPFVIR